MFLFSFYPLYLDRRAFAGRANFFWVFFDRGEKLLSNAHGMC